MCIPQLIGKTLFVIVLAAAVVVCMEVMDLSTNAVQQLCWL